MFDKDSVMFIPPYISCPKCETRYATFYLLERLLLPDSIYKCIACDYIFIKDYVGKFFGVIKDVKMEKE